MKEHQYRLEELDSMVPWERDIYVGLLINYLKKKAEGNQS